MKTADKKWRTYLLSKKPNICAKCGLGGKLQVSHFWTASNSAVRYCEDNCDFLHYHCHYGNLDGWEYQKQGKYREWKLRQLGKKIYSELEKRYYQGKITRQEAIKELMQRIK